MKRHLFIPILMLLAACSGNSATEDHTIKETVLRRAPGNIDDYKFRIKEKKDIGEITVADSIGIIRDAMADALAADLRHAEGVLSATQKLKAIYDGNRLASQSERDEIAAQAAAQQRTVDSLRRMDTLDAEHPYTERGCGEVLVRIIRCSYAVTDPRNGNLVNETFDFYLSPDGSVCYRKEKVKI